MLEPIQARQFHNQLGRDGMNENAPLLRHKLVPKLWLARNRYITGLLLFLLTFATFLPALDNDFVGYDDPEYVTANPHVQQGLTWGTLRWAFSSTEVAAWHPLAWLSHALDCQLFGLQPWGHHLTAIVLHSLNAVLCFLVCLRLTGAAGRSWVVAAIFALHPLRVESVAWVSERKDVLSMSFFLLTLLSYSAYARTFEGKPGKRDNSTRSRWLLGLSLVMFILGLLSKPMLVTVPLVLLLLDFWPLRRFQSRSLLRLVTEKVPFGVAAVAVSVITILAQPRGTAGASAAAWVARLENVSINYCRYLGKFFWPTKLAPFYPPHDHWATSVWISAVLFLLLITAVVIRARASRPYLLCGWLWFLGTLLPVIGLIQIGDQSIADRYSYLPGIGLALALIWAISKFEVGWSLHTIALGTVSATLLVMCVGLTRVQLANWRNSEALFRHTLAVTHGNYLAHNNLGVVLGQQGRWSEAINQYELALEIKPNYVEALVNLGAAQDQQGQLDKALQKYQAALRERPDFAAAHNGLGLVYQKQGRFEEAAQQFRAALSSKPDYADAHFNLALELELRGELDQAASEFHRTLQLQPNSADAHSNLGVVLEKQGRLDDAIQQYVAALRLQPTFARAHYNLGVALAKKGMITEAIAAFQTALQLKPDYPAAETNLAILKSVSR